MKKIIFILISCLLMTSIAEAKSYRKHHHRHHKGYYISDVATGIVGTTAGILLAEELMSMRRSSRPQSKPKVYIVEPEGKCYTIVSKKSGKVTQKCVEQDSDEIIYID